MGREDKKEEFLSNLGRATMRGIRRCKKCGTLNGTRGYSCKNSSCDAIFKNIALKKIPSSEPCRIIGGSSVEIFSVRIRERGPDYRGFVQLSDLTGSGGISSNRNVADNPLIQNGSKCYIETCSNNYKSQDRTVSCAHVKAASVCLKYSEPLLLKQSILNSLPIPLDIKSEILELATDTSGPLVQRVSQSVMVVKCLPSSSHPLGFLHFTFNQTKSRVDGSLKFFCGCRGKVIQLYTDDIPGGRDTRRCVHFYSCLVALGSHQSLSKEFSFFIRLAKSDGSSKDILSNLKKVSHEIDDEEEEEDDEDEEQMEDEEALKVRVSGQEEPITLCSIEASPADKDSVSDETAMEEVERSFLILNDSGAGGPCQVEVEVVRDGTDLLDIPIEDAHHIKNEIDSKLEIQLQTEEAIQLQNTNGESVAVHRLSDSIPISAHFKSEQLESSSSSKNLNRKNDSKHFSQLKKTSNLSESDVTFTFTSWLESVKEKINQTMHYGFPGTPDPLIFHIPKSFFWCLLERINTASNSKKRRLPHDSHTLIRNDAIPLGKFIKFTWKLTSLDQVQQVFTCNEKPLKTTQYFVRQMDGSYKPSQRPEVLPEEEQIALQGGATPIRPNECKTVLRVGQIGLLKEPVPFIIEWIPDILPQSQIGELWIKFEFDHFCNGQAVIKQQPVIITKTKVSPRSLGPPLAPRPPANKIPISVSSTENVIFPISDSTSSNEGITILTF